MMSSMLLAGLERTLNALLARDPAAPSRLSRLAGQRLLVRLARPELAVALHFHPQGLDLLCPESPDEARYDAIVVLDAGTAGALLGGEAIERLMFQGRLQVRGRIALLEATRDLLLDLDLDLDGEASLARWLGERHAHRLAEGYRRAQRWGRRTRGELHADLAEFVFEEARLLPGRHQFEALRDHLTELQVATDRLEARVARLRRRLPGEAT
jgi:ubiquinone biosynthesis accessory factor UbiJ